ncbi:MAG: NAD(P)-dependent oxidoreductase [Litorilinea sp.]
MRVFVTGNQGRIGSVIQQQLEGAGHEVVGFDIATGDDICDGAAVRAAAQGCDATIHLASLLGRAEDDPDETMDVGLQGTWHVLQAAQENQMQRVVYFSSVNALGVFMGQAAPDYFPIDDEHPARPRSTYGMAKHLAEEMCRHFTFNTGIPTVCLRPPAVWVPEWYAEIRKRRAEDPESEWNRRWEYGAFCDVRDVAAAAVLGLTCPDPGHVRILLCADEIASEMPSREIAAKVHPDVPWRGGPEFDANPYTALVSTRLAKEVLGWQPRHSWRETATK